MDDLWWGGRGGACPEDKGKGKCFIAAAGDSSSFNF